MQFIIEQNVTIAPGVYHMRLGGDTRGILRPGQFVQVALPGFYLRRPISVCDWQAGEKGTLDLIYKVVGHGTACMSRLEPGAELDLLTGLGNGYDMDGSDEAAVSGQPLLVGGGVGVPPLYGLAKRLIAAGKTPHVVMGFNTAAEVFWLKAFEAIGAKVTVSTADGSMGVKGFVTDAIRAEQIPCDYVYACGPEPMLKALYDLCADIPGQYSFEERMACGFGVCMGCSCKTKYGNKRICKDGPVLYREEIIW